VRGKVYDVTRFVNQHPGGKKILLAYTGTDATQTFEKTHPWVNPEGLLKPIGFLPMPYVGAPAPTPQTPEEGKS